MQDGRPRVTQARAVVASKHGQNVLWACIAVRADAGRADELIGPHRWHSHVDVEQYGLADPLNLGNDTFEVKRLCEHDFKDLLHIN